MSIILYLLKIHLISVYACIKLIHRRRNQVFFLSRQFNEPSLNYKLLMEELDKKGIKYKYLCKKVDSSINDSLRTQGNYSNTSIFLKKLISNLASSLGYYFGLYKQMRLIAQSKVIIVDGYNLPVSLLKHKKGTKVIQMWHALAAIKKFGYQTVGNKDGVSSKVAKILKMHANYDYVLSGSIGMNPFFAEAFNVSEDKVLAIGTPTVDFLRKKDDKIIKKIHEKYPVMKKKINVLYLPTFRNDKRDNTDDLIKNFDFQKANLIVSFHPKAEFEINDDRVIKLNNSGFCSFDAMKAVDYVITDYSSTMVEAAVTGKKILLYVYDYEKYKEENGLNINLLEDFPHITFKKSKDIIDIISNNKYDNSEYKKFKDKYVPNVTNSTSKLTDLIWRCLNEKN